MTFSFRKAILAFVIRDVAPLSLLSRLLRQPSTSATATLSPSTVMFPGWLILMHMIVIFGTLKESPTSSENLLSRFVFSCMCAYFTASTARSSAKSRSSRNDVRVHWIPQGASDVVWLMTQSITTRKRMGDRMQPCLTPNLTSTILSGRHPSRMIHVLHWK